MIAPSIAGAATSITAFVGPLPQGPQQAPVAISTSPISSAALVPSPAPGAGPIGFAVFRQWRHQRLCRARGDACARQYRRLWRPGGRGRPLQPRCGRNLQPSVNFGLRPSLTPRALARSRPSVVRVRIKSLSNYASLPKTTSIKRPCAVVVSAATLFRESLTPLIS